MRLNSPTYRTPLETTCYFTTTEEMRAGQPVAFAASSCYAPQSTRLPKKSLIGDCIPDGTASTDAASSVDSLYHFTSTVCPPPRAWNPSGSLPAYGIPEESIYYPPEPRFSDSTLAVGPYHGLTPQFADGGAPFYPEEAAQASKDKLPVATHPHDAKLPQRRGATQLWEFLLDLLNEPGNEAVITWIDETALMFRVHDPDELAHRWGVLKTRPKMNYDKLSRSLRYYYQKKLLTKIASEKYVYKFLCHPSVLYASLGEKEPTKLKGSDSTQSAGRRGKRRNPSADNTMSDEPATDQRPKRTCESGAFSDCLFEPPAPAPVPPPQRICAPISNQFAAATAIECSIALNSDLYPKLPAVAATVPASTAAVNLLSPISSAPSPSPQSPARSGFCPSDSEESITAQTLSEFLREVMDSDEISLSTDEDIEERILQVDDGHCPLSYPAKFSSPSSL